MKKDLIQILKILLVSFALSFGVSYVYAWTAPTGAPPSGGGSVSTVLNVGENLQTKTGDLWLGSAAFLGVVGGGSFGGNLEVLNSNVIVSGTIDVADTGDVCDASSAGRIKYIGSDFLGCNGYSWESLTTG